MESYYRILKVQHNATNEEIRKSFRSLVLKWHPDKHGPGSKDAATEVFLRVTEAYRCLSDTPQREIYDIKCATIVFSDPSDPANWFREQYQREKRARQAETERRRTQEREQNAARQRERQERQERQEREKRAAEEARRRETEERESRSREEPEDDYNDQTSGHTHSDTGIHSPEEIPKSEPSSSSSPEPQNASDIPEATPEPPIPEVKLENEEEYWYNYFFSKAKPRFSTESSYKMSVPATSSGRRWSEAELDGLMDLRREHPVGTCGWDYIASLLNSKFKMGRSAAAAKGKYYKSWRMEAYN
ncbi:hypothetical protein DRE_03519 [Drechslerella stenobrocha 248]|uniref:J domain-containing protein n=1 Tax=Drechslerella stenobrocha 248 TaxID=1043628 RepID=W7IDT5_9PEZI|nr:hypothetical protein DRE_03519 [Drechslerella stenobrocha 248]